MTDRFYTRDERLNRLLCGGFERGKVYVTVSKIGESPMVFVYSLMLQCRKRGSMGVVSGQWDSTSFSRIVAEYWKGSESVPREPFVGRFWDAMYVQNDVGLVADCMSRVKDMLIMEGSVLKAADGTRASSNTRTILEVARVAERLNRAAMIVLESDPNGDLHLDSDPAVLREIVTRARFLEVETREKILSVSDGRSELLYDIGPGSQIRIF